VDASTALRSLPERYQVALRALASGADVDDLADALEIPPASVHTFVRLAVAKLSTALATDDGGGGGEP
jgi:DNA-directed RNA polymerase specialized sigma24 family protein